LSKLGGGLETQRGSDSAESGQFFTPPQARAGIFPVPRRRRGYVDGLSRTSSCARLRTPPAAQRLALYFNSLAGIINRNARRAHLIGWHGTSGSVRTNSHRPRSGSAQRRSFPLSWLRRANILVQMGAGYDMPRRRLVVSEAAPLSTYRKMRFAIDEHAFPTVSTLSEATCIRPCPFRAMGQFAFRAIRQSR
jgi:hypothetical protein